MGHRLESIQGEVDGEGAALALDAGEGDLAAEEADEFAADGEAEAGAAVDAGGGSVALREGFEDALLVVLVDADAAVADRERDHALRGAQRRALAAPAAGREADLD